jgi:type VI secretion system protein ImpC
MAVSKDRIGFDISAESRFNVPMPRDDEPFRIALIGDFAAGPSRLPLESRRPISVDPDNFEQVLSRLDVHIESPAGPIRIAMLDDFHPDSLYEKLPLFRECRELQRRLANPSTFAEAAREMLGEAVAPAPARCAISGNLLDDILGDAGATPKPGRTRDELQNFIRAAAQSSLVPGQDPRAPELIRQVDEAAANKMRIILHDPAFKAAECAWRTVFQLLGRLDIGTQLKLYLVDVSKEEIRANPERLRRMLIDESGPWAVLACNFQLGAGDWALMRQLGSIARDANAPCIAEADSSVIGDSDPRSDWNLFRRAPEARWLGLAVPRLLLRAPYGAESAPCERFNFEEFRGKPDLRSMLYANPAPFCAMLLGQAFEASGWDLRPGEVRDIDKLPVFVYEDDETGDTMSAPGAEIVLAENTAEALVSAGIMPLVFVRGTDTVRVVRFQSVADPPSPLAGRWSAR